MGGRLGDAFLARRDGPVDRPEEAAHGAQHVVDEGVVEAFLARKFDAAQRARLILQVAVEAPSSISRPALAGSSGSMRPSTECASWCLAHFEQDVRDFEHVARSPACSSRWLAWKALNVASRVKPGRMADLRQHREGERFSGACWISLTHSASASA
jgi:hypothetical protein